MEPVYKQDPDNLDEIDKVAMLLDYSLSLALNAQNSGGQRVPLQAITELAQATLKFKEQIGILEVPR